MKKLIIKTSVITIILIVVFGFIFVALSGVLYPKAVADMAFRLNNKSICVKYSEKQYLKSGEIEDLKLLTERAIWAENNQLTIKYASILLNSDDFSKLENSNDLETYIASGYAEALYLTGNKSKSIEVALSYYTGESGLSPLRVLIYTAKNDNDTLNQLLKKLNAFESKTEETVYLINEIKNLLK
ncbi:MAG: hypothetical protein J6Q38_00195 [Clostridia bacterium]|nr:hypothetical protein [Clostridia bacterium]